MHQPRPIAYVVSMVAGMESFVYREVEEIYGKGMQVVLFATKYKKNDIFAPKAEWPTHTLKLSGLVLRAPWLALQLLLNVKLSLEAIKIGGLIDLIFALVYAPIMKRSNVGQIHCHFGDHKLFVGYFCKRLTGLPLSVTVHAHEMYVNPNEQLFRHALQHCDQIYAISEVAKQRLVDIFGAPADRVSINRLGVNVGQWKPERKIRVMTVGRFQPRKGFDVLFEAAAMLKDLPIEFVVVGFGPLDVYKMAQDLGVEDSIVIFEKLGQPQLRLLYNSCDIYCLPSTTDEEQGTEGIPVVLMEAMACGMPVVATRCGAVHELVEDILVEERDPKALADAIRKFADDPNLRKSAGDKNRQIVSENYSTANINRFIDNLSGLQAGP